MCLLCLNPTYKITLQKLYVVYIFRWGAECRATHGGYWTHTDRYNPGELQEHKFENAMTIDKVSWGFRRNINMSTIMTMDEMVFEIVSTGSLSPSNLSTATFVYRKILST